MQSLDEDFNAYNINWDDYKDVLMKKLAFDGSFALLIPVIVFLLIMLAMERFISWNLAMVGLLIPLALLYYVYRAVLLTLDYTSKRLEVHSEVFLDLFLNTQLNEDGVPIHNYSAKFQTTVVQIPEEIGLKLEKIEKNTEVVVVRTVYSNLLLDIITIESVEDPLGKRASK